MNVTIIAITLLFRHETSGDRTTNGVILVKADTVIIDIYEINVYETIAVTCYYRQRRVRSVHVHIIHIHITTTTIPASTAINNV
jgi:hypothetical protein